MMDVGLQCTGKSGEESLSLVRAGVFGNDWTCPVRLEKEKKYRRIGNARATCETMRKKPTLFRGNCL